MRRIIIVHRAGRNVVQRRALARSANRSSCSFLVHSGTADYFFCCLGRRSRHPPQRLIRCSGRDHRRAHERHGRSNRCARALHFPEAFAEEATLRATKAGYLTATARALRPATRTVGGPRTIVTIKLPSPEPSIDISGTYTFTVGNSPAWNVIPEPLRVRTYDVILAPHTNPYSFRMNFADRNVHDAWNPAIEIRLRGSEMQMVIGDWNAGIIEDLPSAWITFFGFAQATMTDSGVSGAFLEGGSSYTYCPGLRPGKGTNVTMWDCSAPQSCSKGFRYSLARR